jgi:hypothetical protein
MKRTILAVLAAMLLVATTVPVAVASVAPPTGCEHIKTHAAEYTPDFVCD